MEAAFEKVLAALVALVGPVLTMFDLPGNTLLLLAGIGFSFYDVETYFSRNMLICMLLVYACGEAWEFIVSLFGIKRSDVSWFAVILIAIGGFWGTLLGTAFLPVLGSFLGGVAGAFCMAFIYELLRTGVTQSAFSLAFAAAKMRFLAIIGKLAAGIFLAVLLVKLVLFA